jgi:hypothetical protein
MNRTRWIGGIVATVATAGALAVGSGTAFADTPAPTPARAPGSNQKICTERIPALLKKIDGVTAKINGDASTKGSTAWLQAREDKARAAGHTALADLIQARISNRPQRLTELAQVKTEVLKVQSTDCGSGS